MAVYNVMPLIDFDKRDKRSILSRRRWIYEKKEKKNKILSNILSHEFRELLSSCVF